MRRLQSHRHLLHRCIVLLLFLLRLVKLDVIDVFQRFTRLERSKLFTKLLLVRLRPVPPARSLLSGVGLLLDSRLAKRQREEAVPLNVPRKHGVEELAVDVLLTHLNIVDPAKHDPAAPVVRHGRAGPHRVRRVDGALAPLPPDGGRRFHRAVLRWEGHADEEAVLVDHGLHDVPLALGAALCLLVGRHSGLDPRVAAVEDRPLLVREEGEGRPRVGLELRGWESGLIPHVMLGIEDPEVGEILGLVRGVLEPPEEDDVLLPVRHAVTAPRDGRVPFDLYPGPLPRRWLQAPKVRVVVESALLRRRELAAEQVDVVGVPGAGPSMTRARERRIRRRDAAPLVPVDVVDMQVIVELGHRAIEVLAAEEQQVVRIVGGREHRGVGAGIRRAFQDGLGDLEELLLLALVLGQDLVEVLVILVVAFYLGGLGLCLFLSLGGLLLLLLGL